MTRGLVCTGGGARAAYQAGVLRYVGEAFPEAPPAIVVGSGMGAVNAALLASAREWPVATASVVDGWASLRPDRVFTPRSLWDLVGQMVNHAPSERQSLLDAAPLRETLETAVASSGGLPGSGAHGATGWLQAWAVTTTNYTSLETATWHDGGTLPPWPHARRTARSGPITLDHIHAAASLPLLFPAVSVEGQWHGAGVGMLHPLAPALRLGADRLLVLSTRPEPEAQALNDGSKGKGSGEADAPYPSPLQIASVLSNTLLLDAPEQDANALNRISRLAAKLPPSDRGALKPASVHVLRPSVDLTALANELDVSVGSDLGAVLQYLHAEEAALPDLLSHLLYAPTYLRRLQLIGYTDAEAQHDTLAEWAGGSA